MTCKHSARWKNVLFIAREWAAIVTFLQPEIIFLALEKRRLLLGVESLDC